MAIFKLACRILQVQELALATYNKVIAEEMIGRKLWYNHSHLDVSHNVRLCDLESAPLAPE